MKSDIEKEYESKCRRIEYMAELLEQLPPWDQFEILLRIYWMFFRHKIKEIPMKWVKFQIDLEDDVKCRARCNGNYRNGLMFLHIQM